MNVAQPASRQDYTSVCGTYNKQTRLRKRMRHTQQAVKITQAHVAHATSRHGYTITAMHVAHPARRQGYTSVCGTYNKQTRLRKRMRHTQQAVKVAQAYVARATCRQGWPKRRLARRRPEFRAVLPVSRYISYHTRLISNNSCTRSYSR